MVSFSNKKNYPPVEDFFEIDLLPLEIYVFCSIFGVPLEFQRILLNPLEFSIDILNRGVTIFFLEKSDSKDRLTSTSIRMINVLIINMTNNH